MTTRTWRHRQSRLERRLDLLIRAGLILIVLLAPLPFGSVEVWAFSALELSVAAVALLWLYRLFLFPSTPIVGSPLLWPAAGFLLLMALQLVPLPPAIMKEVSPNTARFYARTVPGYAPETKEIAEVEAVLAGEPAPAGALWLPVSQVPHATRTYLLKGIAFTLFFFLALNAFYSTGRIRWLLYAFVAAGVFQAFYGLIEYLSGHQHIFTYTKKYYTESATGTFINRNHFALFLEMALLAALGLLFSRLREPHPDWSWRERLLALADRRASLNLSLILGIAIIVIALILSFSRAGIVFGLSAAGIFCLLQMRREWTAKKTALVALLATVVLVPAYGVGYWTLTGRYGVLVGEFFTGGGRLTVWENTISIIRNFPLLGTGLGTFQYVFPRYRAASVTAFYDYAHNDYVQLLSELGLAGAFLLAWGVYLVGRAWIRRPSSEVPVGILRLAIGIGLLAAALHELVDFGLQIPANLTAIAFLVACLTLAAKAEARERELPEMIDA